MRHRAADCALLHINDMCQLAATQLARLRRGELPLTINRLDVLRHCARELGQQVDLHFDGAVLDEQAIDSVHALLSSLSANMPGDGGLARQVMPKRGYYLSVRAKFQLALVGGLIWMAVSIWLAQPWIASLSASIGALPSHCRHRSKHRHHSRLHERLPADRPGGRQAPHPHPARPLSADHDPDRRLQ
ncbi:hypothetical protein LP420_36170 [Massilia sp. B-10]|nr:hypothetical protein LP420_36170 [Massilia sp. B-10]